MGEQRNYHDPKYKRWRNLVYKRDKFKCQMPNCPGTDKRLNAHHIKTWSSSPQLRYVVSNGVTLCQTCHTRVSGAEEDYASLFSRVANKAKSDLELQLLMMRYGAKDRPPSDPG